MNAAACIAISNMKPCCRTILSCKNSSIFGYSFRKCDHKTVCNLSKTQFKLSGLRGYVSCSNDKVLGYRCVIDPNRKAFFGSGSDWGQPRVFTSGCRRVDSGGRSVVNVASDYRNHSTSVEGHVNDKSFERIYVRGGLNVKPLVIEGVEDLREEEPRVGVNASSVNIDDSKGLNGSKVFCLVRERCPGLKNRLGICFVVLLLIIVVTLCCSY